MTSYKRDNEIRIHCYVNNGICLQKQKNTISFKKMTRDKQYRLNNLFINAVIKNKKAYFD